MPSDGERKRKVVIAVDMSKWADMAFDCEYQQWRLQTGSPLLDYNVDVTGDPLKHSVTLHIDI